jgi:large subunit ribosomal protein L10
MFRLRLPLSSVRFYATSSLADATRVANADAVQASVHYLKDKDSRKTYLINRYKHIMSESQIVLFLHHNNLLKNEINTYRDQIREFGGDLTIVRNNLMKAYLRAETEAEPASVEAHNKTKRIVHPLSPFLSGPTAIVTIKENNPKIVNKIIKFTNSTNEKLFVVGARVEDNVFDVAKVNRFKDLPTREELQAQLAGMLTVLSGAGLVQTLQSASQHLYLTLESHRKNNDPSEKEES